MAWICEPSLLVLFILVANGAAFAQKAPAVPDRPWDTASLQRRLSVPVRAVPAHLPDPATVYNLAELIDIAEENNPDTRVAWQNAKAVAAGLGFAKAALYPTMAAVALAESSRDDVLLGANYYRQTKASFSPTFELDYTIFDFGERSQAVAISRNNLLAANCQFNDTQRKVIFTVMHAYYQVLDTQGQQDAAEANLENAQTVEQAAEARLTNGLSTLPDVLEARSATARADYDLKATIGATEIAHGNLATALGVSPINPLKLETIDKLNLPQKIDETIEQSINDALRQRPDLLDRVAQLHAAGAQVKQARRAYSPTLSFSGAGGLDRIFGQQYQFPGAYSPTEEAWKAELSLRWTIFDGLARENRLSKAKAEQKLAAAEVDSMRDEVENEVWSAYSTASTALQEQRAAAALLAAARESYDAALKSYNFGVRNQIDVVAAQEKLAEARTADVTARTDLLTAMAALAFQTGDLLNRKGP